MTWIETFSGKRFDLLHPTPESVDVADIAHALARINRYTGHTNGAYSVAEHALHVCRRVVDLYPDRDKHAALHALALHHDSGEYVIGDVSAPMKWLLRRMCLDRTAECGPDVRSDLDIIEDRVQSTILTALGLPRPTPEQKAIIKAADLYMLQVERWSLLPNAGKHPWGTNEGQPEGWRRHRIHQDGWRMASVTEMEGRFARRSESLLAALPGRPKET
jgi:uncharacterized protein